MRLDGLEISCGDLVTFSATSTDLAFLVVEIYQHACQQNPHEMLKAQKCEISENAVVKLTEDFRDGPLEKLWGGGGWGILEPQEFFFGIKSNSLSEFFLGHSMNIF